MKRISGIFFIIILIFIVQANADYHIKMTIYSNVLGPGFQGIRVQKTEPDEWWISSERLIQHGLDDSFLIDLNKKKYYRLRHKIKKYLVTDLPIELNAIFPKELAEILKTAATKTKTNSTTTVTPAEQNVIKGLQCQKYKVDTTDNAAQPPKTTTAFYWTAQNQEFNLYWSKFNEVYKAARKLLEALDPDEIREMEKISGFKVALENPTALDLPYKIELELFEEAPFPDELFTIPAGYKKVDKWKMADMLSD